MKEKPGVEVSIVVPVYNEEQAIGSVLTALRAVLPDSGVTEVIVVDDGSTDRSVEEILKHEGLRLHRHARNLGYGASLRTGIGAALGDIVVTIDGDGQHDPREIAGLLETLKAGGYDLVVGARRKVLHTSCWRLPGKWALTLLVSLLVGRWVPDFNSGFRAFKKEALAKYLDLFPAGFSFSTTSTLVMIERGYLVRFLPISVARRVGRSTVRVRTGFATILLILRLVTMLAPLRLFVPISAILFTFGTAWGVRYLVAGRGLSEAALLSLIASLLLLCFGLLADQVAELRKERRE